MKPKFNFWPYGIISAFVLFAAGLSTAVVIAANHPDNLVSDNYYEQELSYQGQIDSQARAQAAGAVIHFDATAGQMVIGLPPAQLAGKPTGKIEFYRASAANLDRACALTPGQDGFQKVSVADLAAGPWSVRVNWQAAGQKYYLEGKFVVAPR